MTGENETERISSTPAVISFTVPVTLHASRFTSRTPHLDVLDLPNSPPTLDSHDKHDVALGTRGGASVLASRPCPGPLPSSISPNCDGRPPQSRNSRCPGRKGTGRPFTSRQPRRMDQSHLHHRGH